MLGEEGVRGETAVSAKIARAAVALRTIWVNPREPVSSLSESHHEHRLHDFHTQRPEGSCACAERSGGRADAPGPRDGTDPAERARIYRAVAPREGINRRSRVSCRGYQSLEQFAGRQLPRGLFGRTGSLLAVSRAYSHFDRKGFCMFGSVGLDRLVDRLW